MNPDHDDAKSIFLKAIETHSPDQWPAYLDGACGDNAPLRGRVDELLRAHADLGTFHDGAVAVDEMEPIAEQVGTFVGPYKIREQIGEGGMGVVYVAEQLEPVRRKVVLKIIKPGMDTRQVISRFEAERQALAMMDHPNIAKVLDADTTESGRPYFVMELVRGIPITEYCDKNRLTTRERLDLFMAVCQAVQHAHQKGIIHRDLKPDNVMVTMIDGSPVPKVIDFGVAKAIDKRLTEDSIYTHFTQMVGTPLYMSPEQAELTGQDVDTRSDIYSLGVLLYELLTGSTPFDSQTLREAGFDEMRRIIREDQPPRPSDRISTLAGEALSTVSLERGSDPRKLSHLIRGDLDWIVMKALEKDRTRRYETASALAADLSHYLTDEPVEARPPSATYKARKFARRNKRTLVTAFVLVATVATVASIGYVRTSAALVEVEQQRRRALNLFSSSVVSLFRTPRVTVGPADRIYVTFANGEVLRCDAKSGRLIDEFTNLGLRSDNLGHIGSMFGTDINHDGHQEFYAVDIQSGSGQIVDGLTGAWIKNIVIPPSRRYDNPPRQQRINIAEDGMIYDLRHDGIWRIDGQTGRHLNTLPVTAPDRIHRFAVDREHNVWGLCSEPTTVARYDGKTGELLGEIVALSAIGMTDATDLAFGPDGHLYVSARDRVLIYDVNQRKPIDVIRARNIAPITRILFQIDGTMCVHTGNNLLRYKESTTEFEVLIDYPHLRVAHLARQAPTEPESHLSEMGSTVLNRLAWSLVWNPEPSIEDLRRARVFATKAVALSPQRGSFWNTLGVVHYRAGDWRKCIESQLKAAQLRGYSGYEAFFLSMSHRQLGNDREAQAWYRRGVDLLPIDDQYETRRYRTEALQLLGGLEESITATGVKLQSETPESEEQSNTN